MIDFAASADEAGERLDVIAARHINTSRSFIKKLGDENKIKVDGEHVKAGFKLRGGERITIAFDPTELDQIPDIDIPVIYEDDDCIVINKPVGTLTHSKGVYNPEATVATFLRSRINNMDGERAGIVHRLDRATSGVMICAKNSNALHWLQKQFSLRKVKKTYIAIIAGTIEPIHALIDMPIERNPKAPATFRVGSNGKPATTEYKVEKSSEHYSLIILTPTTGRTHQLRVHLKHLGHPIVGDTIYGGEPAERLFLHAQSLEITLPNRERKIFTAPLPKEFYMKIK